MANLAIRPVPTTIIGRKTARAVINRQSWLNLTGSEVVRKLIGLGLRYDDEILARDFSDYQVMPWTNGQGITTELIVSPDGAQLKDKSAVWRVSLAAVSKKYSRFSDLPGYKRIITVVDGAGFRLKVKGKEPIEVRRGIIRSLEGEDIFDCELINGPCLDLNVIYKPDQVEASMEILRFEERGEYLYDIEIRKDETLVLICLEGAGRILGKLGNRELGGTIPQFGSLRATQAEIGNSVTIKSLRAGTRFALVRVRNISE